MRRASQKYKKWKRYKEVRVSWADYDVHRLSDCKRVLDLRNLFLELDTSVQRREFKLSNLVILILFKIIFGISYRSIASATKDLKIYTALGMKRAPCYKTIQNTMRHLNERILSTINRSLVPSRITLSGIDSSGLKTHRKGAWVQLQFQHYSQRREFKKVHIFVDLTSKKIIHCMVTDGTTADSTQLKPMLNQCKWIKVNLILGDKGYDTEECFNAITRYGATPGIPVKKNASPQPADISPRKKAVHIQQKDFDKWKATVRYTMRCVVEAVFSGIKRRFGEYLFSVKNRFRIVEI